MNLRSNYEVGTSRWATRRAQWLALGLSDEDMVKPKIAIVNSSSQLAICFSHLDEIARRTKRAIELAGGVGFEVRTAAPSDFVHSAGHRGGYILSARDLITNDIEMQVEGALLDGMICLASCDKTAPGQLMAAARLNIPTIMVACGYQASGSYKGRHCDIEDVFVAGGQEHVLDVAVPPLVAAAGLVAAGHDDRGDVQPGRGHQLAGRGLVAGGQADHPVQQCALHLHLDVVGDEVAGGQDVPAAVPRAVDEVAGRGGAHLEADAAGQLDRALGPASDLVQVAEADRQLRRGVHDRDLGLDHVLVGQPEGQPLGPAGRPPGGTDLVVAAQVHFSPSSRGARGVAPPTPRSTSTTPLSMRTQSPVAMASQGS